MGEDGSVTPEKQLLKLIEGSDDGFLKKAQIQRSKKGFMSFGSLRGALSGRFSFFKRSAKENIQSTYKLKISFGFVNKALFVVVISLFVYLVATTVASAISLRRIPNLTPETAKDLPLNPKNVSLVKDENYYVEKVSARDIFKEVDLARQEEENKNRIASAGENEATKSLSLVGISWSLNPDAIIEDKARQKTYFVKKGQSLGDGYVVEAIYKDKVILSHSGERFELR